MFGFFKKKELKLYAPITGKVIHITEVPDMAFAEKMIGDGVAIEPTNGMVFAPCDGRVVQIFPTNHAVGIETKDGIDILIHLGIDTVELHGEGFKRLIEEGQIVTAGTPLIKMDLDKIKKQGKDTISPIIITTMENITKLDVVTIENIEAGKDIIIKAQLK